MQPCLLGLTVGQIVRTHVRARAARIGAPASAIRVANVRVLIHAWHMPCFGHSCCKRTCADTRMLLHKKARYLCLFDVDKHHATSLRLV